MEFNFPQNLQYCQRIVEDVSGLLYYSHIPSALAAFFIGIFVLFKSKFSLLSKILFSISLVFSFWVVANLLIWIFYYKNSLVMAIWAPIEVFSVLLYILCLYFTYVFIEKKDLSIWLKYISTVPLFVTILATPTNYNLTAFDIQECISVENSLYTSYIVYVKLFYSLWIILFSVYKYFTVDKFFRKQILIMTTGIIIFLLSFLFAGYLAEETSVFIYEAIGLFGMVVFIGVLGYLIVKFKTFNIKLIASQALVVSLLVLISAQFFFIRNNTNRILTGITLILAFVFGSYLVKSVKREIEQRENIEQLAVELKDANDQLKELDRQKDELLGIVAHQLAKPITAIRWDLESLLDGDLGQMNEKQKTEANIMRGQAVNLADLVSMILDVSRIQLGRIQLAPQPLNLNEFFAEILQVIQPQIIQKKLNFIKKMPKTLPTVLLDKRYTRMTVENMLTNAVKYTPDGGKVTFDLKIENGVLRCSVSDTGCGIPKEEQGKIFGKMYRASNVRNTVEGNGFGLYVAKGAIEGQGGKMWFTSEEGKGTTFFIELPLKEVGKK